MDRIKLPQERIKLPPRLDVRWEGVFEKYSRGYVARNYWRVKAVFPSEEDALQEAALIWVRCYNYYSLTVDNPAWFMSLFKMSLANDWNTFATKASRRRDTDVRLRLEAEGAAAPVAHSEGPLAAALAGASLELKIVLSTIGSAPAEALELLFGARTPELLNRTLRRFCGIKTGGHDVMAELRNLIGPEAK